MSKFIATPIPNVKSPSLAKTLRKVKAKFDDYKTELDNITSDIKEVESFLKNSGVTQEFILRVTHWTKNPEEYLTQSPKKNGPYADCITWEKHDESKQFRLMHKLLGEEDFNEEAYVIFSRPLLESSVITRRRVFPYLNDFLEAFSKAISVNTLKFEDELDWDPIPSEESEQDDDQELEF